MSIESRDKKGSGNLSVVIVNDHAYVNGGASRVAIRSARALAERGIQVSLLAAVGPVCDDLQGQPNLTVTCLNEQPYNKSRFRRSVFAGIWDQGAKRAFEQMLAGIRGPTVVHFHSNRDALSNSVFSPVFDAKLPLVYTCHEYGIACPYASFFDHKRNAPCGKRALSLTCLGTHCNRKGYDKKLWTYARQFVQNRSLHLPERIGDAIFVSEFSQRILEPYIGERVRQHIVANPIDAVRGEQRMLSSGSPFLFAGFLTDVKDPVTAAAAAARAGVRIRFVGEGECREAILEANPKAEIAGWLEPAQVREEMMKARALVLPSIWYETQGMVAQEAMAAGLPVIVSKACAASETVREGINGFLAAPGSVEQFAAAMAKLQDDATACEMGKAAYAGYWSKPAEIGSHVDQLLRIYERALAQ